jgi:hypothetical protein
MVSASTAAADSKVLGEVHSQVHTEMPNTVILPDWEHAR